MPYYYFSLTNYKIKKIVLMKYLNNKLNYNILLIALVVTIFQIIFSSLATVIIFLFLCLNSSKSEIIKNDQLKNLSLYTLAKDIRRYSIIPFIKEL